MAELSTYNVTWSSPSPDSSGSMPLGNGDIGLNAWVEPGGDLVFLISKTDAWSENARLLKIGRVRIQFGVPRVDSFEQTLDLESGAIQIMLNDIRVRVCVDAHHPVICVQADSAQPFDLRAGVEIWREAAREIAGDELFSAYGLSDAPHPVIQAGDTLLDAPVDGLPPSVVWYHRNTTSAWPESMALQGLDRLAPPSADPLIGRAFGAAMLGDGLARAGATALASVAPSRRQALYVHVLTAQTGSAGDWLEALRQQVAQVNRIDPGERQSAHRQWWRDFWGRSHLFAGGDAGAEAATRSYVLQRYITACAGRGAWPIKFNGSLFTVDNHDEMWNGRAYTTDPDYRSWGGPYWFQNTRLAYWPMLAGGDYDMMLPLFRMYLDALPLLKARTRLYFQHDGAFFPETMEFWGAYANTNYGWDRAGKPVHLTDNTYIRYYYSCGLELLTLMLDYYEHTLDAAFARSSLIPWAEEILRFYDQHYRRDASGRLWMHPAQALETWQNAVNPAPDVAGLQFTLDRLLAWTGRPGGLSSPAAGDWRRLRAELPDLPMRHDGGQALLDVAGAVLEESKNVENAELYAIFPFRLYGARKPGLDIGRATFAARRFRHNVGWCQDSIQAACLGLAAEARSMLVERVGKKHAGSRFPAFWGPNFDWIPDQDHGTAAMITLQHMLLQADDGRILLFPAWPKDWDVSFKLRAPQNTLIEGVYRGGRLEALEVTPASRRPDVVVIEPQE